MAANYAKAKGRRDSGRFIAIPHSVLDHPDYIDRTGGAIKLLNELVRQYNGSNNGDLTVAYSILQHRGFNSKDTITRTKNELVKAGLILLTRQGQFINPGAKCDLYAITWRSIDECPSKNLDVRSTKTPYRKFSIKNPSPENGTSSNQKQVRPRPRGKSGRFISS
jgi:hypothetical protein